VLSKKTKKMIQKLNLSKKDFDDIQAAVEKEEKKTSGEIALALIRESDSYSFWELFFSVIVGGFVFSLLLPLSPFFEKFLASFLWTYSSWQLPAVIGLITFFVIALIFNIANIPSIDRFIIPYVVRHRAVYLRALRHFVESGVYATRDHSGILIFISVMEREVRILADIGLAEKIEQEKWNTIAQELSAAFKANAVKEGLEKAIHDCGLLLQEHFPVQEDNPNELADGLVVLEVAE
jgi:putative membrane protein